jgi:TrmH family RNA methyltransferase
VQAPIVILVGTGHPGNAGAAARGAANFGSAELRFVAPRCDVQGDEAMHRAKHAAPLLAKAGIYATLQEALAGSSISVGTTARTTSAEKRFLRKPLDIRDWAESMRDFDGVVALVFGPEDTGLVSEHVNLMDQLVTVPTADYASLNLAHAVSLVGYEVFRMRQAKTTAERKLSPGALAALGKAWDALVDSVEPRSWRREATKGMFRKVVGRSAPDDHEIHNIVGVLTNALRRFSHPDYASPKSHRVLSARGLLAQPVDEEE